jgi:thymidylate kinase
MIIMIEGARGAGKSTLVDRFFENNTDPNVIYYKFAFSDYIKLLGMEGHETGPGIHYFSISNIITILDIANTVLKDKIVVFDRSIFSAYVWSIYRERLPKHELLIEFHKYLMSPMYSNVKVIKIDKGDPNHSVDRVKDPIFDLYEDYEAENAIYNEVLSLCIDPIQDMTKGNTALKFINNMDENSHDEFAKLLSTIIDK